MEELEIYRIFRKRDFGNGPNASKLYLCKLGKRKPLIWITLKTLKIDEFYQNIVKALNMLEKDGGGRIKVLSCCPREDSTTLNPEWILLARRRQ